MLHLHSPPAKPEHVLAGGIGYRRWPFCGWDCRNCPSLQVCPENTQAESSKLVRLVRCASGDSRVWKCSIPRNRVRRVLVRRLCHNGELPFHYGDRNFRRFTYAQSSELETQLAELMLKKKGGLAPTSGGQEFQCYRVGSHRPHHKCWTRRVQLPAQEGSSTEVRSLTSQPTNSEIRFSISLTRRERTR